MARARSRKTKDDRINMRLEPRTKKLLMVLAKRHRRSMTGEIEDMVRERAHRELGA